MKTTLSKRQRGVETPPQRARLAAQRAAGTDNRAWHERRVIDAEKRAAARAKVKREAGPQGGRLRALARLAGLFGNTPVVAAAVQRVERDRRGRMVPHRNLDRDRSLPGKARVRARRLEQRKAAER